MTRRSSACDQRLTLHVPHGFDGAAAFRQTYLRAALAQLVEQLPCKHQVIGSSPIGGSIHASRAAPLPSWAARFFLAPPALCTLRPLHTRNVYVGTRCASGVRTPGMHFAPTYTFGTVAQNVGCNEAALGESRAIGYLVCFLGLFSVVLAL